MGTRMSLRAINLRCRAAALVIAISAPGPLYAQVSTEGELEIRQDAARSKGEEALRLFRAERFDEAYKEFREADALFHAPTFVLYMARCQHKRGKLLEASALYQRLLAEPLPENASDAFRRAQEAGRVELATVEERTPKVTIVLTGVPAESASVTLDGSPVRLGSGEIKLNPGRHTIEAKVENAEPRARSFTLAEGSAARIELVLTPSSVGGSLMPAFLAFGVGVAALGVGAITGAVSLSKVSDLKSRCKGNLCPIKDQGEADVARAFGDASTAAFSIGGAVMAVGVVLAVVRPFGGAEPAASSARAPATGGVTWTASVGIGRGEIRGSF
jgi:hypothetical protein